MAVITLLSLLVVDAFQFHLPPSVLFYDFPPATSLFKLCFAIVDLLAATFSSHSAYLFHLYFPPAVASLTISHLSGYGLTHHPLLQAPFVPLHHISCIVFIFVLLLTQASSGLLLPLAFVCAHPVSIFIILGWPDCVRLGAGVLSFGRCPSLFRWVNRALLDWGCCLLAAFFLPVICTMMVLFLGAHGCVGSLSRRIGFSFGSLLWLFGFV